MAHIDTDEHGAHRVQLGWELHGVEVTAHLGVDLAQDVAGLGQVKLVGVLPGDHLRRHAELLHDLLVGGIIVLVLQQDYHHLRVLEALVTTHEVHQFGFHCP